MKRLVDCKALACTFFLIAAAAAGAVAAEPSGSVRAITVDVDGATTPRNRMAEFSVGSDYPGTLIREESLAQLATVSEELGFR